MIDRKLTEGRMTPWGKITFLDPDRDSIVFEHQEARPACVVSPTWCIRQVWIVKICPGTLVSQPKMYQKGNDWVSSFEDADVYDSELDAINTVSIIAKNKKYAGRAFQIEKVYLSQS